MTIGVGVITCNRPFFFNDLMKSLTGCKDRIDHLVVVNDGSKDSDLHMEYGLRIDNEVNIGVGKSKNKALRYLLEKGCGYIFLIEDDMIILDPNVFNKYIEAYKESNIHHFNYGPSTPFNRKQKVQFDIHNRDTINQESDPAPKTIIEYNNDVKVSIFPHCAGSFSFFTREVLEKVGLYDESFYNAWEHVEHTYRIIKAGYHPPFWCFADIHNSHLFIHEAEDAINRSSIATKEKSKEWYENVYGGREIYKQKHGHYPNEITPPSKEVLVNWFKQHKKI